MSTAHLVLAWVLLQRLGELLLAARNTSALLRDGAVEVDARGYPAFVLLHACWLAALFVLVPGAASPSGPLLAFFGVLQLGRLWVIASLGRRWTTRILVKPGAALVRRGPYRFLPHPNYAIVTAEIAVLPLTFGAVGIALVFSVLNAALLARRIRIENQALEPVRAGVRPRDVPDRAALRR
jgi:methyltransferase